MSNYINEVQGSILNGLLEGTLSFDKGLNLISGENGTLKTQLLKAIGTSEMRLLTELPDVTPRFMTISPKRELLRSSTRELERYQRSSGLLIDSLLGGHREHPIQDTGTQTYPSIGELYFASWAKRCLDGGDRRTRMRAITEEFNTVISSVFPNYSLHTVWDNIIGGPKIHLRKRGNQQVPIEGLSLGEIDVLSLLMYIFLSRDTFDVCLIDEPEIHLNWHLEEGLFRYLNDFCDTFEKQMIIVTHSRAIFRPPFLDKTQFLVWNDEDKIEVRKELTDEQLARLIGEAVQIIRLADFSQPTFFVEDDTHESVIEALASSLGAQVSVQQCDNCANVTSLYQMAKKTGGWGNAIFLRDGDNEGNRFLRERKFIHLERYCMENYLLDYAVLSRLTNKTESDLKETLLAVVKGNKKSLAKNPTVEVHLGQLTMATFTDEFLRTLDASKFLKEYLVALGIDPTTYIEKYIAACDGAHELKRIFPGALLEFIEQGITE
jgi:hypothetical protein